MKHKLDPLALPPLDERLRYTIPETAAYLRQSRSKTYADIDAGLLEVVRDGRRVYATGRAIVARIQGAVAA